MGPSGGGRKGDARWLAAVAHMRKAGARLPVRQLTGHSFFWYRSRFRPGRNATCFSHLHLLNQAELMSTHTNLCFSC